MKKVFLFSVTMTMVFFVTAQTKTKPKVPVKKPVATKIVFKNLLDSFSYAAGYNVATNMKTQNIANINTAIMQKAIEDVYKGNQPVLSNDDMNAIMQKQVAAFSRSASTAEIARGVAFLDANKKRPGVITLKDGLQYEILKSGDSTTATAGPMDTVVVNYTGSLIDGHEFNNSYKDGRPAIFVVSGVIKGWTEALRLMRVGDKWKVFVPTELAYYLSPRDPTVIPPGAALVFEIALEEIKPATTQQ